MAATTVRTSRTTFRSKVSATGKLTNGRIPKKIDRYIRKQVRQSRTGGSGSAEDDFDDDYDGRDLPPSPLLDPKFRVSGYFSRRDIGRLKVRELDSQGALQRLSIDELEQRLERRFDLDKSDRNSDLFAPVQEQAPATAKSRRPLRQPVRQRSSSDISEAELKQVRKELREHREHFANKVRAEKRAQKEFQEGALTSDRLPTNFSGGDVKKIERSRPSDGESEAGTSRLEAPRAKFQAPWAQQSDAEREDEQAVQVKDDTPAIPAGSKMHKTKSFDAWLMPAQVVPKQEVVVPKRQEPKPKDKGSTRIGDGAFKRMYNTFFNRQMHPLPWERVDFDNVWMQVSNQSWADIGLDGDEGTLLVKQLEKFGVTTPNILQERALPEIMSGKDVLISTNTGSGKTLAFVLPLLQKFVLPRADYEYKRSRLPNHLQPMILCRPQVLFVAPSRELAQQIFQICEDLLEPFPSLNATLLVGNYNHKKQDERLKNLRPAVVVGTPGRLMDHSMEGRLVLNQLSAVVLDEVDGLLSFSRQDHIKLLLQHIGGSETTQRILASATGTSWESQEFVGGVFRGEYSIIGPRSGVILPDRVLHLVNGAPDVNKKIQFLLRLQKSEPEARCIMVFCNSHERARKVADTLTYNGMATDLLTANRSKEARKTAIQRFTMGEIQTLVATDAAMRGLDFRDLTHVVNFELPRSAVTYAHRAGRCGRMGYNGLVISLASGGAENRRLRSYADALGFELFEGNVREGRLGVDDGRWYRPASHPDGFGDPYRERRKGQNDQTNPTTLGTVVS
eukprot:TRINITY_DN5865_c0_g1_i5.p1 TRINITY_DN5865_c0_g1~~TRINITY_DN5865_c0_g1_i5.p1  ORF type:complete len:790 (+),score=136.71 TRINITY_DN5865_c0_g1_i5:309-2678(+)